MNQALRHTLEQYFYGDYEEQRDGEEVLKAQGTCYAHLNEVKDPELFSELETAISKSEMAHERQGFLRGYEYCLTMLNLLKEDNGKGGLK